MIFFLLVAAAPAAFPDAQHLRQSAARQRLPLHHRAGRSARLRLRRNPLGRPTHPLVLPSAPLARHARRACRDSDRGGPDLAILRHLHLGRATGGSACLVANVAPQVSGQIVELRMADNQIVHKGDVLYVIDPFDFKVRVDSAQTQVKMRAADLQVKRTQGRASAVAVEPRRLGRGEAAICRHLDHGGGAVRRRPGPARPGRGQPEAHRSAQPPRRWLRDQPAAARRRLRPRPAPPTSRSSTCTPSGSTATSRRPSLRTSAWEMGPASS